MKKLVSLFVIGFFLTIWSCEDLLDKAPLSEINSENYYTTESDAEAAVFACYEYLGGGAFNESFGGVYHGIWITIHALASDEAINNDADITKTDLQNFTHNPNNPHLYKVWRDMYRTIGATNIAIEKIPLIETSEDFTEAERDGLTAEARFIRGLMYFELVRMFGDVPLVTRPVTSITEANAVVKTPASSVYSELIIPDFQYASMHLPAVWSGENTGRATKFSAFGFLGKAYLTLGRYQEAQTALSEVIARSPDQFDLWDDYGDAFRIENNNGKESVFSITHSLTSLFWESGQFNVRWLPIELDKNSLEWELPTENLYNSFDSLDRRKEITFITSVDGEPIDPHISKYWSSDEEPDASSTANDYQLLRYADILLMYAEAENELNGPTPVAHNFVNEVRRRARYHADDNTTHDVLSDLSGLTQEQLRDSILMERKREFAFEGQRWYDLVRADRLVEKVSEAKPGTNVQEHHTLFPIPQRVINISTEEIVQNTGY